jgi:hypothetical protein
MRGVIRSPAERARLVAAFKASGLRAKAFATRSRIPPSTLYQWLAEPSPAVPKIRLARVIRRPDAAAPVVSMSPKPPVVIEVAGARVEVAAGCDRPTLAVVLDILDARRRQDGR